MPNPRPTREIMKLSLNRGLTMYYDEEDHNLAYATKWTANKSKHTFYACAYGKGWNRAWFHRLVMKAVNGQQVDHVDGNGLNNTRGNLRFATHAQNCANARKRKSVTKYRCVYPTKSGKFAAYIKGGKSCKHLGTFPTLIEAAKAYDKAALELYGEFARLNFPALTALCSQDAEIKAIVERKYL